VTAAPLLINTSPPAGRSHFEHDRGTAEAECVQGFAAGPLAVAELKVAPADVVNLACGGPDLLDRRVEALLDVRVL
jgi:hypothetical protein